MTRRVRMGMVGGGPGAFIGAVHRMAARLDGKIDLVCGVFSSDPEKTRSMGKELGIPAERLYADYREMFERESQLSLGQRMDFVSIVTPNYLHYDIARLALASGFHVFCEKPVTTTAQEAVLLREETARSDRLFGVAFNYSAYPLVKHARHLVRSGKLGELRKVVVEYPQGWLAFPIEQEGQKQASWRTDPAKAGPAGCLGDIGTHAFHLAEYITGCSVTEVCADLTSHVQSRRVDDDVSVLLRFAGGARGILHASQVSIDEENGLSIRVYGTQGALEWHQEEPNTLILKWPDRPREIVRAGVNYSQRLCTEALAASRLPCGHPEGFIEAFANLYRAFADAILWREGELDNPPQLDFPTIEAGVRVMQCVEAVLVNAQASGEKWTRINC